jgi:hypothetical protein
MDPQLASWNDGLTKSAITAFVGRVTEKGPDYVEPAARVAVFDNDGTLWTEKPLVIRQHFGCCCCMTMLSGNSTTRPGRSRLWKPLASRIGQW